MLPQAHNLLESESIDSGKEQRNHCIYSIAGFLVLYAYMQNESKWDDWGSDSQPVGYMDKKASYY